MKPTTRNLVMRDPALASLLGLAVESNFGAEPTFGADGDYRSADASNMLAARDERAGLWGNASQLDTDASKLRGEGALVRQAIAQRDATEARLALLDPNRGSHEKIGRYTFSLNQELVLGVSEAIAMTNNPLTDIRPDRLIFNAPCFGFALINVIQAGNMSVVTGGFEDAANYTQVAVNVHLSFPLITTSNRAQISGEYSGLAPSPYTSGGSFGFVGTFQGPARMTI
jgi:hypothetical protein